MSRLGGGIYIYISELRMLLDLFFSRSRALAIVDRLSAVQSSGLTVKKIREEEVQEAHAPVEPAK